MNDENFSAFVHPERRDRSNLEISLYSSEMLCLPSSTTSSLPIGLGSVAIAVFFARWCGVWEVECDLAISLALAVTIGATPLIVMAVSIVVSIVSVVSSLIVVIVSLLF